MFLSWDGLKGTDVFWNELDTSKFLLECDFIVGLINAL